jgi:hypothetical protein
MGKKLKKLAKRLIFTGGYKKPFCVINVSNLPATSLRFLLATAGRQGERPVCVGAEATKGEGGSNHAGVKFTSNGIKNSKKERV